MGTWTRDGPRLRLLNIVDEYTLECLAIEVARQACFCNYLGVDEKDFLGTL